MCSNDYEKAIKQFKKSIELFTGEDKAEIRDIRFQMGYCYLNINKPKKALESFELFYYLSEDTNTNISLKSIRVIKEAKKEIKRRELILRIE